MIDLYRKPLEEAFSALDAPILSNPEWFFTTAYRYKKQIRTLIDAGLTNIFLDLMNERSDHASNSFYALLWNGMIYNVVVEWVKSDTDEPPESAVARMKEALKLLAESIERSDGSKQDAGSEP